MILAALAAGAALFASGVPSSAQDVSGFFKNMFGSSAPPPGSPASPGGAALPADEVPCPQVDVAEGGAALTAYGGGRVGDQGAMRNQISLSNFARECRGQPDGSVAVKVGVQGRVLLGPGGSPGSFTAPIQFTVKNGERIIASRIQRATITVPAGETRGTFTAIQDGFVVPKQDAYEFEIEVGLGSGAAKARPARAARKQG